MSGNRVAADGARGDRRVLPESLGGRGNGGRRRDECAGQQRSGRAEQARAPCRAGKTSARQCLRRQREKHWRPGQRCAGSRNENRRVHRSQRRREPLRRRTRRTVRPACAAHRRYEASSFCRPACLPGRRAARAHADRAKSRDRQGRAAGTKHNRSPSGPWTQAGNHHGRGHRNLSARGRQRRVQRDSAWLVYLHGRRLQPQSRRRWQTSAELRAKPLRLGHGHEPRHR